ncbi:MAG: hypothetical protein ACR2PM_15350, partial [Hyphomicrobiales bacterium]
MVVVVVPIVLVGLIVLVDLILLLALGRSRAVVRRLRLRARLRGRIARFALHGGHRLVRFSQRHDAHGLRQVRAPDIG